MAMKQVDRRHRSDRLEVEQDTEAHSSLPPANAAALERSFARADHSKLEIISRPEMINGEELGQKLGVSRATIDNRRVAGKLLALDIATKRGFRYPAWQCEFLLETPVRDAFETVLSRLARVSPWARYRFLTQSAPALGGNTPIDALRSGRVQEVVQTAATWVQGEQGGG